MLTEIHANAKLIENFRIDVDDRRNHAVPLDQSLPQGTDMGPTALELCLMSLSGCYATIFVLTAQKMRFVLKKLEVNVDAVKSEQVGTITEANVDVLVEANVRRDRLERAHELTLKGCPVGILFEKAGVKMKYNLHIEKE